MDTISGTEKKTQLASNKSLSTGKPLFLERSYDVDTPTVETEAGISRVRISGVDGTEIGTGSDAEYFRDGLMKGIFKNSEGTKSVTGIGIFGRELGKLEVEGLDWRMILHESGVSENWGKYGFDPKGSEEDENYKWYAGKTQSTNVEAYELLASGTSPSDIISDEEYTKIQSLRKSFKKHLENFASGLGDREEAIQVAKELFQNNGKLSKAQKREWYEVAQKSNIGESMLAAWNDPYTQATIKRQERTRSLDITTKVDTSVLGMLKNGYDQQFGRGLRSMDLTSWAVNTGTKVYEALTKDEKDIDNYIRENDVAPDEAVKLYKTFEEYGFGAATDELEYVRLNEETLRQSKKIDKTKPENLGFDSKSANYVANVVFNEASPYIVDPAAYVAGGAVGSLASKVAFTKVASPLMQKMLTGATIGAATGLSDSIVYTSNNYKDFSNEELLKTWATDTAFGGALGAIIAAAVRGVNVYGSRAKFRAAGEGVEDIDYTPERAFTESVDEAQQRTNQMQDEIATELNTGETPPVMDRTVLDEVVLPPRPQPPEINSNSGRLSPEDQAVVDEWEEALQSVEVEATLKHQSDVVQPKLQEISKNHNIVAKAMRTLGKGIGMEEFATKMINNADPKMSYMGTNILETGAGFTGKVKNRASAAIIKESLHVPTTSNLHKVYVDNIEKWAMSGGTGKYKAWKSAWEGGKKNEVTIAFHREVMRHQELLNMGKVPPKDEFVEAYIKQLDITNNKLFEGRVEAGVKGFDKDRRIKHYIPHVWKKVKVAEITKRFGDDAVIDLLQESIEQAKRAGKISDNESTSELAKRQFEWINGLGDSMDAADGVGGSSARGKSRIPLDFTVEKNGISMLDLIDTDLPTMMDSYIQSASADIGISKATNGLIRSEGDFDRFLTPNSDADKVLMQDAKDLLYGRPTRAGMSPELRSLMDMTTLQQMGGIGVAQLAETGTMAQRLIVNYMSQPKIAKKIWAMAGESMDDRGVLSQVRSIAAMNDNIEYLNRYSVNNIDQAQIDELSNLRAASIDAVDKLTLGAYKAQFGRMLGSLSGVNAVQKAQSRLLQASFSVDVARGFKFGKGTSTKARLADLGLTDDGYAAKNIREFVEFDEDGFPTNFNFEDWSTEALDEFTFAMNKEEAQLMPRVMAGELPVFMNKPLWQAIMQFRKTPLAFMSKGMQRNLQFADREAVFGTVLNAMTAGVVRYSKLALAGGAYAALSSEEFRAPDIEKDFEKLQPYNYVSNFGILGDGYSVYSSLAKAFDTKDGIESLWEGAKIIPTVSSVDSAYHALEGDPRAIKQSTPLNTLPMLNEVSNAVIKNMEQD